MIALSLTFLASGLLIFFAMLPLVHRKIPMNALYGVRTKHSFHSEQAWFHLNEVGGMIFAMIGFPLILAGVLGLFLPEALLMEYSYSVLCVSLLSVASAIYFIFSYSVKYTKRTAEAGRV